MEEKGRIYTDLFLKLTKS